MSTFINILLALLILSVLIIFHEFGHFVIARVNGVYVKDFSLGMGPALYTHVSKKTGMKFNIRVFPIGGFCMMKGADEEESSDEDSFNSKSIWQRISIVLAGPVFNFILAFLLAIVIITLAGYDPPVILAVSQDSPAAEAGLKPGDIIKEINGKKIVIGRDMLNYTYFNEITADDIEMTVERDGKKIKLTFGPLESTKYYMGISYSNDPDSEAQIQIMKGFPAEAAGLRDGDVITAIDDIRIESGQDLENYFAEHQVDGSELKVTFKRNTKEHDVTLVPEYKTSYALGFAYNTYRIEAKPLQVLRYSLTEVRYWIGTTVHSLGHMITGKVHSEDVGGAVRAVSEMSDVVEEAKQDGMKYVFLNLIYWAVLLSANLGVMNLLPVPALDGGRLLFLLIELIRGKPVPKNKEAIVHLIGFALLMILMVLILYNDIKNILF